MGDEQALDSMSNDSVGSSSEFSSAESLPFLIRNVVRYRSGVVSILDRRSYPFQVEYVECRDYEEVAEAIKAMVTQSEGPGFCAGYAMVQAARVAEACATATEALEVLLEAHKHLALARPTNNHVSLVTSTLLDTAIEHVAKGLDHRDLEAVVAGAAETEFASYRDRARSAGSYASGLLQDGDSILTHCWAESALIYTFMSAQEEDKDLKVFCTETRPYLQGARLTADAIADLGVPVKVLTDGAPAHLMAEGLIDKYITGADRITRDGHVINKIGTFQIALAAAAFGIPYYPLCYGPDPNAATPSDVKIEIRDPHEVLHIRDVRTATPKAGAVYPAFDVTPPELVAGLVTDRGVFPATEAMRYIEEAQ